VLFTSAVLKTINTSKDLEHTTNIAVLVGGVFGGLVVIVVLITVIILMVCCSR